MSETKGMTAAIADALSKFGDRYDRNARLAPALLVLLPAVVAIIALYGKSLGVLGTIVTTIGVCGGWSLLADFARSRGKSREKAMWAKWGGPPSNQMLRHSDTTFDEVSKARYHTMLAKKIGKKFPTAAEEANNPAAADGVYASAGNWLREATRDEKKYRLLLNDNIAYGFRRNGHALRRLGILVCVCVISWTLLRHGLSPLSDRLHKTTDAEALFSGGEWISLGIAVIMLFAWIGFFTEETVRSAAFSYAHKLVVACESLFSAQTAKASTKEKAGSTSKSTNAGASGRKASSELPEADDASQVVKGRRSARSARSQTDPQ